MTTTKTAASIFSDLQTALAPYAEQVEIRFEPQGIYIPAIVRDGVGRDYSELRGPVRQAVRDISVSITLDEAKVLGASPKDASEFFIIDPEPIEWDDED